MGGLFVGVGSSPHTRGAQCSTTPRRITCRIIPAYAGSTAVPGRHPVHEAGSSPHTRGARVRCRISRSGPGIIPAYAGSTGSCRPARPCREDHPRIRGEHDPGYLRPGVSGGSSPHTRGARLRSGRETLWGRIIPAYAGSTKGSGAILTATPDHPRIRGEHVDVPEQPDERLGSSPHTRGALRLGRVPVADTGIIPAYAGSTGRGYRLRPWSRGSSPHTRGAQPRQTHGPALQGIIPAYAGSTRLGSLGSSTGRDHPRIRGEHIVGSVGMVIGWGSSPHTRGAPDRVDRVHDVGRIIPAYAGSTVCSVTPISRPRDHPRIRGEHTEHTAFTQALMGSSPHTRGAPWTFKTA